MKTFLETELAALRADFANIVGRPFEHFYCPILFSDEATDLIKAHVINQAFPSASRRWTIQRRDVDNFFGAHFEADYVVLDERGKHDLVDVLASPDLARKLRPRILVDGVQVEHYSPGSSIPDEHSPITLEKQGVPTVPLAIKLHPDDVISRLDGNWEVEIRRDLTVPVLVSLLKAAHLTLFKVLGYHYGLSSAGHFFGWEVLGKFYRANFDRPRADVRAAAVEHFREFVNLTRPVLQTPFDIQGTVDDGYIYLCTSSHNPWGMLVFVKAGNDVHSVLVPVLEDAENAARFYRFLNDPGPRFEVRLAKFNDDRWEVAKSTQMIEWPRANPDDLRLEV